MGKESWQWQGFPGHFICADRCKFRLCTAVNGGAYIVSTAGAIMVPYKKNEYETVGCDRLRKLLLMAKCPNCDGGGLYTRQISDDECVQEQCQWCNEMAALMKTQEGR